MPTVRRAPANEVESPPQPPEQVDEQLPNGADAEQTARSSSRPPGRPRNEAKAALPHLPKLPTATYGQKPTAFFRYWRDTHQLFPDRLSTYVYRRWPIIDRDKLDMARYIDLLVIGSSITNEELEDDTWQSTLLQRYGSGQYKLMLNDAGLKKPVCQSVMEVNDDEFPPVVAIEQLTLDHPSNRSYIERLRARGVQIPGEESAEDMANENAMTQLVGTVRELSERNAQLSQRPQQQQPQTRQDEGVAATAAKAGMDIIASAAKMGNSLVDSAINKVAEVQAKAQSAAADPMSSLRSLVEVVKAMQPPPKTEAELKQPTEMTMLINLLTARETASQATTAELQRQLFQVQTQHMAFVEKVATGGGDKAQTATTTAPTSNPQPKSLAEQIKELAAIKDTLSEVLGGSGGDSAPPAKSGGWLDHLPTIIQGAGIIAASISNGMYNYAVARSGQGQPQPLALSPAAPPSTTEDSTYPMLPEHAPMTGPPGIEVTGYQMFLEKIREPLLHSLNVGDTGGDFAAKLSDYEGLVAYESLRGMGRDALLSILSTYPPIWQVVSQMPDRFGTFLDEFIAGPLDDDGANGMGMDDNTDDGDMTILPPMVRLQASKAGDTSGTNTPITSKGAKTPTSTSTLRKRPGVQ